VRCEHPENAKNPIVLILDGIVNDTNLDKSEKASVPIISTPVSIVKSIMF